MVVLLYTQTVKTQPIWRHHGSPSYDAIWVHCSHRAYRTHVNVNAREWFNKHWPRWHGPACWSLTFPQAAKVPQATCGRQWGHPLHLRRALDCLQWAVHERARNARRPPAKRRALPMPRAVLGAVPFGACSVPPEDHCLPPGDFHAGVCAGWVMCVCVSAMCVHARCMASHTYCGYCADLPERSQFGPMR